MTFIESIKHCYQHYADFKGRASRSEFWWFGLFGMLVNIAASVLDPSSRLAVLVLLANFLPSLALCVRRLHDVDRSGWWLLLSLVPLIGFIVLFVWEVSRGTRGPNRFGDDPLSTVVEIVPPAERVEIP